MCSAGPRRWPSSFPTAPKRRRTVCRSSNLSQETLNASESRRRWAALESDWCSAALNLLGMKARAMKVFFGLLVECLGSFFQRHAQRLQGDGSVSLEFAQREGQGRLG